MQEALASIDPRPRPRVQVENTTNNVRKATALAIRNQVAHSVGNILARFVVFRILYIYAIYKCSESARAGKCLILALLSSTFSE